MENIVGLETIYKSYASETYIPTISGDDSLSLLSKTLDIEKCSCELYQILLAFSARYLSGSASLRDYRSVSVKRLFIQEALDKGTDSDAYLLAQLKATYLSEYRRLVELPVISIEDLNRANQKLAKGKKGIGKIRNRGIHIGKSDNLAHYRAPSADKVPALMDDLIKFINDSSVDPLTKTYAAHIQFSLIHPYVDGNGRVSRLLWDVLISRCQSKPLNPSLFRLNTTESNLYKDALEFFPKRPDSFFSQKFWLESLNWSNKKIKEISKEFEVIKSEILPYMILNFFDKNARKEIRKTLFKPVRKYDELNNKLHVDKLFRQGFFKKKLVKNGKGGEVLECEFIVEFYIKIENLIFNEKE